MKIIQPVVALLSTVLVATAESGPLAAADLSGESTPQNQNLRGLSGCLYSDQCLCNMFSRCKGDYGCSKNRCSYTGCSEQSDGTYDCEVVQWTCGGEEYSSDGGALTWTNLDCNPKTNKYCCKSAS